jgi:L-asparagine transporter-like permease
MLKIFAVLAGALVFGFLLSYPLIPWPIKVGYLGIAIMIVSAWIMHRRWETRRKTTGDDPGAPEREVWHCMATTAVVGGHLIGILVQPGFEMHTDASHMHFANNWMLIGGAVVSYFVLHDEEAKRDERDLAISARGITVGYATLTVLLIVLILHLGFAPKSMLAPLTHPLLAHVLIAILVFTSLAHSVAQLVAYRRDAQ